MNHLVSLLAILTVAECSLALADDRRSPNDRTAAVLAEKGISHVEWLLYDGIYSENVGQVQQALRDGADPNASRDFRGPYPAPTPLMAALYAGGRPDIVEALVRAGANVNARYTGTPAPMDNRLTAAQKGYFAATQAMRDPRSKEFFPLYHAVDTNPRTVALLLEAGADPKAVGGSASQAIFKTWDIGIASLLVKYGADVNARNYEGETVLAHAKRELRDVGKSNYRADRIERYCAWLVSVGAKE